MNGTVSHPKTALQEAREGRGVALVVAARASGLLVSQAEALERGDVTSFSSADEMMAAASAYAEALGISREEVLGLLDATVSRGSVSEFSAAVRERSTTSEPAPVAVPSSGVPELPVTPFTVPDGSPDLTPGPVIDDIAETNAAAVTGEIPAVGGSVAGELEQWVQSSSSSTSTEQPHPAIAWLRGVQERMVGAVGPERSEQVRQATGRSREWMHNVVSGARERMRSNEHATLVVALMGGLVLLAVLLAIGSAMDSQEPTQTSATPGKEAPLPPTMDPNRGGEAEVAAKSAAAADTSKDAKKAAKPAAPAIVPPNKITVNVLNAGRQKGLAAQVAAKMKAKGYRIGDVENSKTSYSVPVVLIPANLEREAQRLMKVSGITTMDTVAQGGAQNTVTIVVK